MPAHTISPELADGIAIRLKLVHEGLDSFAKANGITAETRPGMTEDQATETFFEKDYPVLNAIISLAAEINGVLPYCTPKVRDGFWDRPTLAETITGSAAEEPPAQA